MLTKRSEGHLLAESFSFLLIASSYSYELNTHKSMCVFSFLILFMDLYKYIGLTSLCKEA